MTKLKLTKGLSYTFGKIKATIQKPVIEVENAETANKLIKSGYFTAIKTLSAGIPNPPVTGGEGGDLALDKMTDKQLEDYAAENGVDLTGLTKKADKLAKIQEVLKALDEDKNELDFSGDDK